MGKMVAATEFKAKCLALIDGMERSGEPLTVTRRGKASITLTANRPAPPSIIPVTGPIARDAGGLRGAIHGDPCDRIMIATARALTCPLPTTDRSILADTAAGHLQAVDARR